MDIRSAILMAADHIEANPGEFNFLTTGIPSAAHCGTPGCALGWIGAFAGTTEMTRTHWRTNRGMATISSVARNEIAMQSGSDKLRGDDWSLLGITMGEFYFRMGRLVRRWKDSSAACAKALRLYADLFHPAKPIQLPNWQLMAASRTVPDHADGNAVEAS